MVKCSLLNKDKCTFPCKWEKGKGCKRKNIFSTTHAIVSDDSHSKCQIGKVLAPDAMNCIELKYVGAGSYGCVMSPPISEASLILKEYIPYLKRENTDVGKVFIKGMRDFKEELAVLKKIDKIDPHAEFTVKLKGALELSSKSLKFHPTITNCLERSISHSSVRNSLQQIILSNGGTSIESREYTLHYYDFLKKLSKFLKGMINLQKNNICHRDMSTRNVLINSQQISLIDFGLTCDIDDLYIPTSSALRILSFKSYRFYPPEFYIAYIMLSNRHQFEGNKQKFDNFVDTIYDKMKSQYYFEQKYLLNNISLLYEYEYGIRVFLDTIKHMSVTKCSEIFNRDIAFKADVFSLSYTILELSKNIYYTSDSEKIFVDYIYKKCKKANVFERISLNELYEIVDNEVTKKSYIFGGKTNKASIKTKKTPTSQHKFIYSIDKDTELLHFDNYIGPRISIKRRSRAKNLDPYIEQHISRKKTNISPKV